MPPGLPVLSVIRRIFQSRVFPKELKISSLRQINKSGTYSDIFNFRPISLLSSINKIIEKVITNQIIDFLESNSLLGEYQYGFHRKRSCENTVYQLLSSINEADDMEMSTITIFCDLSKAFDTVHHERLLNKLSRIGFAGLSMDLLRSHLKSKTQIFVTEGIETAPVEINCGIPQGGVQLFFIIFTNDLMKVRIPAQIISFADDMALVFKQKHWLMFSVTPCRSSILEHSMTEKFRISSVEVSSHRYTRGDPSKSSETICL